MVVYINNIETLNNFKTSNYVLYLTQNSVKEENASSLTDDNVKIIEEINSDIIEIKKEITEEVKFLKNYKTILFLNNFLERR